MRAFFDTSVLVAAFLGDHPHHKASAKVFAGAGKEHSSCGVHTLAELYSVFTSLPLKPMIAPEQAILFLGDVRSRLSLIALNEAEYFAAIEQTAGQRISGGRIYDALLLQCALKAKADVIYTWNLKHFRQLAPVLAGTIKTP
ncbi:MAG: PIN domain-containing protein [Elusimicrobiota bacterium]|nr:PIN domain-containing protein [Elusimicrobiota bacterium]